MFIFKLGECRGLLTRCTDQDLEYLQDWAAGYFADYGGVTRMIEEEQRRRREAAGR